MDVTTALRQQPMSAYRWYAVLLCMWCNAIDGLDLLLISYALPHLPADFAAGESKGLLISLGFVGMAIGSIFIAPLADRIGRRTLVVAGLVVATLALAATAVAPSLEWMLAMRLLTGVSVGLLTPLVHVLADEYASQNRRSFCVGIVSLGFPIGSALGGMISLLVINAFGGEWHVLFWFGAAVTFTAAITAWVSLPESPAFLISRGTSSSRRIEQVAARMRLLDVDPRAERLEPDQSTTADIGETSGGVLRPRLRKRSLLLWVGYSCGTLGYYFINSWTPQLISTATGSTETGALVGTIISVGAIVGGLAFALVAVRVLPTKLCWVALCAAVLAQIVFAVTLSGATALVAAAVLGMGMQAALSAYMTSCARLYPTELRARALGLMAGFSRAGAITAPLIVGAVLAVVTARAMYLASSLIVFVSVVAAFGLWTITKDALAKEDDADRTAPSGRTSTKASTSAQD